MVMGFGNERNAASRAEDAAAGSQNPLPWKNVPYHLAFGRSVADVGSLRTIF
jgi:hypothetical protein